MQGVKTFVIDLFCGAGGTSTGIFYADTNIEVVACINHDKNAILSHAMNYPNCLHFTEDIRTVELSPLKAHIDELRAKNPGCKIAIWASLECTNFSKAKCGPKDCDSRTLAEHIFRYLDVFEPEFLWIENVEEFRLWGPLDENGNPIKEQEGASYREWVNTLTTKYFGPEYYDKTLSSDDFGGMTIRKRLFLQFAKDGRMIGDPKPTHGKGLKPVVPVKEALNLELEGNEVIINILPKDCNWTIQVKKYMWKNELIDVQQRWLEPEEMLKIQGFPDGYKLVGTKTEKKKFIGNSVERYVCQALIRSIDEKIQACVSELEPCI